MKKQPKENGVTGKEKDFLNSKNVLCRPGSAICEPILIYKPFNEQLPKPWSSSIKPYHQATIDTIRKHDPHYLIICGTPSWSRDINLALNDPL